MCDLIVVGCGITGLVTGLYAAKKGLSVKILEARDRIGGQILTKRFVDSDTCMDLGAQYFDVHQHTALLELLRHYDLDYLATTPAPQSSLWLFENKDMAICTEVILTLKRTSAYQKAIDEINSDICEISLQFRLTSEMMFSNFSSPYHSVLSDFADYCFMEYVDKRLKVTGMLKEYIMTHILILSNADPSTQSAVSVLYMLAGFGSAEMAFERCSMLHSVRDGMGSLIFRMANEFLRLGGEIELLTPILSIQLKPKMGKSYMAGFVRMPDYDIVHLYTDKGELHVARGVVVAMPAACVASIAFSPPIAESIRKFSSRGNGNQEGAKLWVRAGGIDVKRIKQVYASSQPCKISRVLGSIVVADGLHREEAVQFDNREVVTTDRKYTHMRVSSINHSILKGSPAAPREMSLNVLLLFGLRAELHPVSLKVIGALKCHYPEAFSVSLANDDEDSVDCVRSKNITRSFRLVGCLVANNISNTLDNNGSARTGVAIGSRILDVEDVIQIVNRSFVFHDFTNDPWTRGSWFSLRAGFTALHKRVVWDAIAPWNTTRTATGPELTRFSSNVNGASDTTVVEGGLLVEPWMQVYTEATLESTNKNVQKHLRIRQENLIGAKKGTDDSAESVCSSDSLIIAGGDYSPLWTGWLNGAVLSGTQAAERICAYLTPAVEQSNFVRRKYEHVSSSRQQK